MKLPALVLIGCVALAQDAIRVGQLVSGELDGAKARAIVTSFAPGDYISATQRGKVDVRIRQTDGTLVRQYRDQANQGIAGRSLLLLKMAASTASNS